MCFKTKQELEQLSTKRLLDIYRLERQHTYGYYCDWYDEDFEEDIDEKQEKYCDLLKSILDTREHVVDKGRRKESYIRVSVGKKCKKFRISNKLKIGDNLYTVTGLKTLNKKIKYHLKCNEAYWDWNQDVEPWSPWKVKRKDRKCLMLSQDKRGNINNIELTFRDKI